MNGANEVKCGSYLAEPQPFVYSLMFFAIFTCVIMRESIRMKKFINPTVEVVIGVTGGIQ